MNNKNTLSLMTPAAWHGDMWREGLPCGNGTIGAMIYGNIADETILINHSHLRHWGKKSSLPDISQSLEKSRQLMDQGKYLEANSVSSNMLKEKDYDGKLFPPCPLCDIKLHTDIPVSFSNYSRTLNMETGEVTMNWDEENHHFKRRTFVSRTDDILAIKLEGTRDLAAKIFIQLHETYKADTKRMKEECKDTIEIFIKGHYLYYAVKNDDGMDFGAVIKILSSDDVYIEDATKFCIRTSSQITIFADFFIKEDRHQAFKRLTEKLSNMNKPYEAYLEKHAKEHRTLFNSCDISIAEEASAQYAEEVLLHIYKGNIPNELYEKLWRFGRYLLISGTKDTPFPLYGLWGGGYNLMWSHNMANENLQMIYWHTLTGGLEHTLKPVIDYYTGLLKDFQLNARNIFGLSGIYVPAGTSPGMGLPNQIVPVIMNWIGAAGWLAQHFYQYYLYTGDEILLKEKILPFMEHAIAFYEEYLIVDKTGYYKIYPSVSPENSPQNFFTEPAHYRVPHICPSVINATMDFAIIKELLTNMIEVSEEQNLYKSKINKWRDMLTHIPPYEKNEDGAIREWMHKEFQDKYAHRHISHIYPIFPGTEYILGRDDEDMLAAFERAINKRVLGSQTGWSFSHLASIYARFGKGEKAIECLNTLAKSCLLKNYMTLHNDWRRMGLTMNLGEGNTAPMQLDANMGIVNAIQEMLLFVSKDILKILPACPVRFNKGSVKHFRFCTGEISFTWDNEQQEFNCEIIVKRDTDISLLLPKIGETYELEYVEHNMKQRVSNNDLLHIELKKGNHLIIHSKNKKDIV